MKTTIGALNPGDRAQWQELWTGYLAFYEASLPATTCDQTWQRLIEKTGSLRGLCIRDEQSNQMVGITHFLLHESAWTDLMICYLQDLFVDPAYRGLGLGKLLIEAVANEARTLNCERLYWLTHQNNTAARGLYDKVASCKGFVRYEYQLYK